MGLGIMRLDSKLSIVRVLQVLGVNGLFKLRNGRDITFPYWLSSLIELKLIQEEAVRSQA
jgi:hypothetical protein